MKSILVADSIGKSFGGRKVLSSARIEARPGVVTLVTGRNGAGKSTLLKIAAGRVAADYGTIRFGGRLHERPRLDKLARAGLFFLPDREILSTSLTLRQQLTAFARRFPGPPVQDAAAALGLAALLDRTPEAFSGGERRRAEFALAMVRAPRCLIADEPLRGIDPKDAELLLACVRDLARAGCAVLVSGHEVKTLMDAVDEVVWVTAGTSYALGSPDRALEDERFRREYLTGSWW